MKRSNPVKHPRERGITLIQMILLIAIVLLVALMILPNIKRIRINMNEIAIRDALRNFNEANQSFRSSQATPAYAETIEALIAPSDGPSYLNMSWQNKAKFGFLLAYRGGGKPHPDSYALTAMPQIRGITAQNTYCIDQTGIIVGSQGTENHPQGLALGCNGGIPVTG